MHDAASRVLDSNSRGLDSATALSSFVPKRVKAFRGSLTIVIVVAWALACLGSVGLHPDRRCDLQLLAVRALPCHSALQVLNYSSSGSGGHCPVILAQPLLG